MRAEGGKQSNVAGLTRLSDHRSFGPLERWRRRQSGGGRATAYTQWGPNSRDKAVPLQAAPWLCRERARL